MLDMSAVAALADTLTAAGVDTHADPTKVRTPGAWVRHQGFSADLLGGFTHKLQLHLVVGDNGYLRARDELVALLDQVLDVLDPDEDPFFQGLALPGRADPLPGLVVPFNLPSTYTQE